MLTAPITVISKGCTETPFLLAWADQRNRRNDVVKSED
jgi:hypothetical protein